MTQYGAAVPLADQVMSHSVTDDLPVLNMEEVDAGASGREQVQEQDEDEDDAEYLSTDYEDSDGDHDDDNDDDDSLYDDLAYINAQLQWEESLNQIKSLVGIVILPLIGKVIGRRFASVIWRRVMNAIF